MAAVEGKKLRTGITTGACAAAATKAALLLLQGAAAEKISVETPQRKWLTVPIKKTEKTVFGALACVEKDAGDDPDITNGVDIWAEVVLTAKDSAITIRGGKGIGIVTKPGLSTAVGEPAINPGPRWMIERAVQSVFPSGQGVDITISIPAGVELAKRTLNPALGIEGGISVLGTTGIVHPMSEEAWKSSLVPQIRMVKALGHEDIVFVPGKIGQNMAIERYGLPRDQVVQTSNFVGYMLEHAVECGMKRVLLLGHIGKMIKVAGGIFHTHNRMADARLEIMAAYLASIGAGTDVVRRILACVTTEEALPIIEQNGFRHVYRLLAQRATLRAERYIFNGLKVGTVMITLKGDLLGYDESACRIGGDLGWNIK